MTNQNLLILIPGTTLLNWPIVVEGIISYWKEEMLVFIYKIYICKCYLKKALYIITFKQNIFSVQAATRIGVHISFDCENSKLIYPHGTLLNIKKKEDVLYYLKKCHFCKKCQLWLI